MVRGIHHLLRIAETQGALLIRLKQGCAARSSSFKHAISLELSSTLTQTSVGVIEESSLGNLGKRTRFMGSRMRNSEAGQRERDCLLELKDLHF